MEDLEGTLGFTEDSLTAVIPVQLVQNKDSHMSEHPRVRVGFCTSSVRMKRWLGLCLTYEKAQPFFFPLDRVHGKIVPLFNLLFRITSKQEF